MFMVANTLLAKATLLLSPNSEWEGTPKLYVNSVDTRREEELGSLMQSIYGRIIRLSELILSRYSARGNHFFSILT